MEIFGIILCSSSQGCSQDTSHELDRNSLASKDSLLMTFFHDRKETKNEHNGNFDIAFGRIYSIIVCR